jgi:hypothetical protein
VRTRASQALGHAVDADDALDAAVARDAHGHVADRAEPQHDERAAGWHRGVLERLPRRRQHVGEVDEPVVRTARRHLDRQGVAERHAQVLGLPPGTCP